MKKTIILLFSLMLTLNLAAQGRCSGFITDKDGYTNVRQGTSTKTKAVRRLDDGAQVYFSPTGTNWYQVALSPTGAYIGYVYNDRITADETKSYKVTDPDGWTNVREQPNAKSKVVKRLNRGQVFTGATTYVDGKPSRWIGVLDNSFKLIGYVYETKVKAAN